jgi:mannosyl-3-phosphoglycerate phosphatase
LSVPPGKLTDYFENNPPKCYVSGNDAQNRKTAVFQTKPVCTRENTMDFPLLVFTDLDGTLLDHQSYSFQGAADALQRLQHHSIPLILTSSKTRAELEALQKKLGLHAPFIVENGGGLFIPRDYDLPPTVALETAGEYYTLVFGRPYSSIREVFETLQPRYSIKGFCDMSVAGIMKLTGLLEKDALRARQREFSEPFIFLAEPRLEELKEEAAARGLQVTRGGRFFHLLGAGQDKGRAVAAATRLFQAGCLRKIITVGLGDAANDLPMLRAVDIPVLIQKPDGSFEETGLPGVRCSPFPGSRGWGAAMTAILDEWLLQPGFHHSGGPEMTENTQ